MSRKTTLKTSLPYILSIGGIIGFLASFVLTMEKIERLKDPSTQLLCDINPILSCGSVMNTEQASAFGIPNSLIGIASFAAITTIGMALLAGADFMRWFWQGLQLGTLFGVGFVTWLQVQSIFIIGSLCLYCLIVWAVMLPIFWYTLLYNLREGHVPTPPNLKGLVAFSQRHHGDVLLVWYLLIVGAILYEFWYYWETLI